jgi:hypothetical protein
MLQIFVTRIKIYILEVYQEVVIKGLGIGRRLRLVKFLHAYGGEVSAKSLKATGREK